jgi:hypothetical protein
MNQPKSNPHRSVDIASAFVIGAILIALPLAAIGSYFNSMAGWGDGATGDAISNPSTKATLSILPLFIYFISGFIAALSTNQTVRISLFWTAHICFIGSVFYGLDRQLAVIICAIIMALFTKCWMKLIRGKISGDNNRSETQENEIQ